MKKKDLRLTILGCFRYSLGRMTYMVQHTCEIIKDNADIFNYQDWKRFINEIEEAPNLGMSFDIRMWSELKEFSRQELKRLEDKTESKKGVRR